MKSTAASSGHGCSYGTECPGSSGSSRRIRYFHGMAAEPLCRFEGFKGRQQIVHLNGVTVIDDSYNASRFPWSGDRSTWLFAMWRKADRCSCRYEGIRTGYCKIPSGGRCFLKRASADQVVLYGELAKEIGAGLKAAGGDIPLTEVKAWKNWNNGWMTM